MTKKVFLSASAVVMATALLHCASRDVLLAVGDDAGTASDDVFVPETGDPDATPDAGVSDASTEDELEVPDGAVICDATPCAVALSGSWGYGTGPTFCALLSNGNVECWGSNAMKRLGYDSGAMPFSTAPQRVDSLSNVSHISVGGDNACARVADGGVYCWGAPELVNAGAVPDAGEAPAEGALPTEQGRVPAAVTVSVGQTNSACVTTPTGALSCWGHNERSELARAASTSFEPPGEVPLGGRTTAIGAPGDGRGFAVTSDGELFSWGTTRCPTESMSFPCTYRIGRDVSEDTDPIPKLVPGLAGVRGISSSATHSCAIAGRKVLCWGGNDSGELGRGTTKFSWLPGPTMLAEVTGADGADAGALAEDLPLQVSAGEANTCAVVASGRVYCWGMLSRSSWSSDRDELGRPVRIDGLHGPAVAVASAYVTTCALLRSGMVECWGSNLMGLLGRGSDENIDNPLALEPAPAPVVFSGN